MERKKNRGEKEKVLIPSLYPLAIGFLYMSNFLNGGGDWVEKFLVLLNEATKPELTTKFMGLMSLGVITGAVLIYGIFYGIGWMLYKISKKE